MPRSMWKGAISFGLVTIPVSVYPATEEKTLRFNQLHDEDGGRIRMKRTCSVDGEEVTYDHIVKGYEYEKDKYVVLTDDDFDAVPVASSRAIDIVQFVDLEDIDPILYKKTYYLIPEETGAKAYALLREAMSQVNKVGIAKVSFRDKEHLSALRFKDDAFVLETMYWPDEIREADFGGVDVDAKVRDQELDMAKTLIENLTADWNPDEFTDEYREALLKIVEAKIAGEEIEFVEAEPTAKVVDLMAALKASVDAAKKRPADDAKRPPRRRPRGSPRRRSPRPSPPPRRRPLARLLRGRRHRGSEPPAGIHVPARNARRPGRRRRARDGVGADVHRRVRGCTGHAPVRVGGGIVRHGARHPGDPCRRRGACRVRAALDARSGAAPLSRVRSGRPVVRGTGPRIVDHRVDGDGDALSDRAGVDGATVELGAGRQRGRDRAARDARIRSHQNLLGDDYGSGRFVRSRRRRPRA